MMESFKTKYPFTTNPRTTKISVCMFVSSYLLFAVSHLLDKEYFFAGLFFVLAATMFIVQYPVLIKSGKREEPPFSGIIIDQEKIKVCHFGYTGTKEILMKDIKSIHLNSPYNDTLEITMKDRKNTRVPLYWYVEEDQAKIKELLRDYLH
jgi:hypothetical protein